MEKTAVELENDTVDHPLIESTQPPSSAENPTAESPTAAVLKRNEFMARKTAAHAMMDAALFMANISQLRMIMTDDSATTRFFVPLLCLIVFSILCQIVFALLILVIWARETHRSHEQAEPGHEPNTSSGGKQDPPTTSHRAATRSSKDDLVHNHLPSSPSNRLGMGSSTLLNGRMTSVEMDESTTHEGGRDGGDVKFDVVTRRIHIVTLLLVFLITVANMFITGLGFDSAGVRGRGQFEQKSMETAV